MNPTLSENDDMEDVLDAKDALPKYRNPWLVMVCHVIIPAFLVAGGVLSFKFFPRNSSYIDSVGASEFIVAKEDGSSIGSKTVKRLAKRIANVPKELALTIESEKSLNDVFDALGVDKKQAKAILALRKADPLKKLQEGRSLNILFGASKDEIQKIEYEINDLDTLIVTAKDDGWQVDTRHIEPTTSVKYLASTINGSIYVSARKAGISPKLTMQFAKIFKHQINPKIIRSGDKFALFYEEYNAKGKKISDGNIVAAELIHRGKKHRVVAFTYPDGRTRFYTPEGESVEQTINRFPLKYRRVASRFSRSRLHPILRIRRAHLGVDLVASRGTPVRATSDGRISFAGRKGGYGKVIELKFGKYSSLYAHLSKFSKKARKGRYVKRGDIIGYVGSTGLSTSPHLHYEIRVNGRHRDPLRVKLPTGGMIASKHRKEFFGMSKKMLSQLDSYREEKILAMNTKPEVNISAVN